MSHALLSPSASHRWIECPPSVRLTEFMEDKPSPYADEGTAFRVNMCTPKGNTQAEETKMNEKTTNDR